MRGGGPGGSGGSFERIRGRGKTRLRDRAPLLQRQQDVSDHLSPTTFLTSPRTGPAPPRAGRNTDEVHLDPTSGSERKASG